MQISASYTSASLSVTGTASETSTRPARVAASGDRVTLSDRSRELSFSLNLAYEHLEVTAESAAVEKGPDGQAVTYTGMSAEVSSMSASLTMAVAGDSATAPGKGAHLNDEVSQIAKEVKPFVKAFAAAAGLDGGWGQVNRLLRSVV